MAWLLANGIADWSALGSNETAEAEVGPQRSPPVTNEGLVLTIVRSEASDPIRNIHITLAGHAGT
jgi:hypothetical protein